MSRFLITEVPKHHALLSHILFILERTIPGDKVTITKEIGSGYHIQVEQVAQPKPREE